MAIDLPFTTVFAPCACAMSSTTCARVGGGGGTMDMRAPADECALELIEPAVEIGQRLAPDRGRLLLPLGVRGGDIGRGVQAAIEIAECVLQVGVGDRPRGSFLEVVSGRGDAVRHRGNPAARRSATCTGSGPPPVRSRRPPRCIKQARSVLTR